MQKETEAWFLNASNDTGDLRPSGGGNFGGATQWTGGTTPNPVGVWTHVALTYDGSNLRLFTNGTQVSSLAVTGAIQTNLNPLWTGGNSPYGEYFNGLTDDARVYNRALSAAEIQTDMNTSLGTPPPPDTTPPSTPTGVAATATGAATVNVSWTASTDNVGV